MIANLVAVAGGGAIGAALRFLVNAGMLRLAPGFPWGTVTVNVLGSFAMGVIAMMLVEKGLMRFAPFLLTGVLGGFTTFSAFSLDAFFLVERGRYWAAGGYVAGSVALSIAALVLGAWLGRRMVA